MKKFIMSTIILAFMAGCLTGQAQQKNGKAVFAKESHDFGSIKETDGPATFVFDFTNSGTDPLILKNVQASCGCTTPDWPKEPILPGKAGSIKVTYNPANRPGSFEKSITVTSDGNPGTQVLKINGSVVPKPQAPAPPPASAPVAPAPPAK
jgi:hypothetical protein